MVRSRLTITIGCTGVLIACPGLLAEEYGGIEFPSGAASFADAVVSYVPGSGGVSEPPENALGVPGNGNVSIGNGGVLIVEFVDNVLVDQTEFEGGLDLFVFEAGSATESMEVAISSDGVDFIDLGTISGQPTGIDIGPFITPGETFRFVRITDVLGDHFQNGGFAGADIDAVGAIGSVLCLGDLTGDCVVDASDLAALLAAWGPCPACPADLNDDGVVDAADLAILLSNWG